MSLVLGAASLLPSASLTCCPSLALDPDPDKAAPLVRVRRCGPLPRGLESSLVPDADDAEAVGFKVLARGCVHVPSVYHPEPSRSLTARGPRRLPVLPPMPGPRVLA